MRNRLLLFLPVAALLLSALLPVAGYRHLWQDEVDTAERARSVIATGLPRSVDPEGRLSLNAGGLELEEGSLHRYHPWAPFYAAALGLRLGRAAGFSDDASVRAPFILTHALSSALLGYGLYALAGLSPIPSLALSGLFGCQTIRLLFNRSCRYHSLLDFLLVLGLLGTGLCARDRRNSGAPLAAAAIFLLPQVHVMSGSLFAGLLLLLGILASLARGRVPAEAMRENSHALLAIAFSLALALGLTHPWSQGAWIAAGGESRFRSLWGAEIQYGLYFFVAAPLYAYIKGNKRFALSLALLLVYLFLGLRLLDLHPFSQTRYYLALPIFFLFWMIALPMPEGLRPGRRELTAFLAFGLILPEFLGTFSPWQGLRLVATDWQLQAKREEQPLRQALELIRRSGDRGAVLVDYVPQFANWYLRDREIAWMPDRSLMNPLNERNPAWSLASPDPEWHLAFLTAGNGQWPCSPNCDVHSEAAGRAPDRYRLVSGARGKSLEMCVVRRWVTDRWNNAPFAGYLPESLNAAGAPGDELTLARLCR